MLRVVVAACCVAGAVSLIFGGRCEAQPDERSSGGFAERFYFDSRTFGPRSRRSPPGFLKGWGISPAEAAPAAPPPSAPTATDSSDSSSTGTAPASTGASNASAPHIERTKSPRGRRIAKGRASYYEHSGKTASGEIYNPDRLTAAHKTLPLGTRVRVVNLDNGKATIVRINDRMPAHLRNVIDLSRGSARAVGITRKKGVANVALYQLN